MTYSPEPNKLIKTLKKIHENVGRVFSTGQSKYESMWDSSIDHSRDGIHGFSVTYAPNTDDLIVVIIDIDNSDFESKIIFAEKEIHFFEDAWTSDVSSTIRGYKDYDEGMYFQLSTLEDIPEFEVIRICAEYHDKFLYAVGMK